MVLRAHKTLEEIHTKVITEFSKTLEMFGLTPAEARLCVSLYIHDAPMTLDEMSEALGKSKTSMSTGVRSLVDQGLVARVWKKGVRKDLFQATDNLYKNLMTSYIKKWQKAANDQENELNNISEQLELRYQEFSNKGQMEEAEQLYQRLGKMINFHQQLLHSIHKLDKIDRID